MVSYHMLLCNKIPIYTPYGHQIKLLANAAVFTDYVTM